MERRRLELVADRAIERQRIEEVVGVDRLRRAGEAVDAFRHQRRRHHRRMQKRALADDAVRIGNLAAQE